MIKRFLPGILLFGLLQILGAQTTIDKTVATIKLVKTEAISQRQLKSDVENLQKAAGTAFTPEMVKQVLDARINSLLFVQYCEREKINVPDSEVSKAVAQMKASLGPGATDADLEKQLKATGVFVEPKVYVKQRMLFETYVQVKHANELKAVLQQPSADEILKAYDLSKASLVRPDTMRVSVLYVDTRGKSEAEIKKGRESLQSITSTLKINPSKFDEYMLRASDEAGYKSIPSLYVEKTTQNKNLFGTEFFDSVFKLKAGDISSVIESPTGYRIVRANEFLPQKQLGLADTVPGNPNMTIQQFLAVQVAQDKESSFLDTLEKELIAKLRTEANIKIFEENLTW
ncbi:MAG: peptidyl-prolyl cis-trans isomerase [Spirochaetia bacterium]|jgi:parvulin-like peptidyl-prolyl isomerase|nr:peptidyl-prolyl cis-trans isomerase [Spirochaetia bacterium]